MFLGYVKRQVTNMLICFFSVCFFFLAMPFPFINVALVAHSDIVHRDYVSY